MLIAVGKAQVIGFSTALETLAIAPPSFFDSSMLQHSDNPQWRIILLKSLNHTNNNTG